jgi:hypothetical protein
MTLNAPKLSMATAVTGFAAGLRSRITLHDDAKNIQKTQIPIVAVMICVHNSSAVKNETLFQAWNASTCICDIVISMCMVSWV